jgi:ankyrin repeat protein
MAAADEGRTPAVQMLLDLGLDPNASDEDGNTALIMAASDGHAATVRVLLEAR